MHKVKSIKIYRAPTVEGMKPRIKPMIWNTRKEKAFNQNSRKKKDFKKMRIGLGTSGTTLNVTTSEFRGARSRRTTVRN